MTTARERGLEVLRDILPEMLPDGGGEERIGAEGFALGIADLALENVFGSLWARPGLDRRARSLVTLGILIASRSEDELRFHFKIARRNGLTRSELEEVVYHASGYAGFPAASTAGRIGREVLDNPTDDTH